MALKGGAQRDLTLACARFHELHRLLDEADQIGRLEFVLLSALVDARKIQNVFDEGSEPATFLDDEPEIVGLFLRVGDLAAVEALGQEPDGGNGRAQLMRDTGDKV